MQNSTRMKVAAFVTSLALSLPGGTALATEATVALDDTATTTVETQETTTQDAVTQDAPSTEVDQTGEADQTANEAQAADAAVPTEDEGLEPMATITTSDGTVLDLNNLNGYEPTAEELAESIIASKPGIYGDMRDRLIAGYMEGYVNENAQDPSRWKYYFRVATDWGTSYYIFYDTQTGDWFSPGGYDEGGSGTSGTTEESTVEASPAYFANYVSPTANTVADDAPAATTTAAVPATSDPTSFVGAAALAATSLGAFVSAKALRRK